MVELDSELALSPALEYGLRHHRTRGRVPGKNRLTIRLRHRRFREPLEPTGTPLLLARKVPVHGRLASPDYWLGAGRAGVEGDLRFGRATFDLPSQRWMNEPTFLRTLFPLALVLHLAERGLFYLHAAVVVDPEERGWALIGGGGAGKSTTAYSLVRRGWRYLCDDGALLRRGRGGIEALDFFDEFHLARDLKSTFPELSFSRGSPATAKGTVPMERLFPHARVERAAISRVVLLQRRSAAGTPGRSQHLAMLIEDNPFIFAHCSAAHLDTLAGLLGQSQTGKVRVDEALLLEPDRALQAALRRR